MTTPPPSPIPAATLVLFRSGGGTPELLFVERSRTMAFAGGALVFPGGRVDPGDHALAARFDGDPDECAARIAAIRETLEEVGLAIGLQAIDADRLAGLRAALHGGVGFGDALVAAQAVLAIDGLVPFARWCPSHAPARIFDTRFFLAEVPADAPDPVVDDTENVRVFWATAQTVLDLADSGAAKIIFPTRRNLERLAQFDSFRAAVADTADRPMRTVTPWVEDRDGMPHLCIPTDLGYPVTAEPMEDAVRG
ncbi:NUDIX domain-containing protein [Sphingomonas sp. TREG-RG-20F-R18-01]|uniref:NUDIX hydrolase n=1 Tax=Sphingomonas sp. TREG-RG-20F-R18-01 TaxID=2914982 RepID=UPI001F584AE3|nr:NUDIX domain-containing protein [Sphingomonas sp. TREG-RG-20F-R18-01]